MFLIASKDEFLLGHIANLFKQKNICITHDIKQKYFLSINCEISNKTLFISFNKKQIQYNLPILFEEVVYKLLQELSKFEYNFNNLIYNPINQTVGLNNKIIKLKSFHNIIIKELILNKDLGVKKNVIYSKLWPNDKLLLINKLDTHLTNLKNFLKEELNFDLKFSSIAGQIKLI